MTLALPRRLAALTAFIAVILVVGATEVALSLSDRSRLEDLHTESMALANALAAYLTRVAPSGDPAALAEALDDWSGHHLTATRAWVLLRGPGGFTTVPPGSEQPDAVDDAALATHEMQTHLHDGTDSGWHVAVPLGRGAGYGVANVQLSTRRLAAWSLLERRRAYLAAFVAALLVALSVAFITSRWIGRPLAAIGRAMAGAHGGAEGAPEAPEIGPAEFRALARRYNRLRAALAMRERESAARAALLALEEHARSLERLALVQQTAAGLAHEIGTPLNTVNGHLQLLRDDLAGAHQTVAARRVELLLTQVERVAGIVRAGLQRGTWPTPVAVPVDLAAVSSRMLQFLEPAFADAGVAARQRAPALPLAAARAVADPQLVEQILLNLLKNSLEALAPGQHVTVETGADDGCAYVDVTDDGPGLTDEARHLLFRPFSTVNKPGGTGLGLAVSRQLARTLGGDLVHLPRARGTGWRLSLPRAA